MPRFSISWPLTFNDPNLRAWRVYGNPDDENDANAWQLLKEVPAKERTATVDVDEGRWHFRVCGLSRIEQETPIELTDTRATEIVTARGTGQVPPVPGNPAAHATMHGVIRVVVDAPEPNTVPHRIQLVRLPAGGPTTEAGLGSLIGEYVARPRGPQGDDAQRVLVELPISGYGRDNANELSRLIIRSMSQDGQPSASVTLTPAEVSPPFPPSGTLRSLATIGRNPATVVGFPAATVDDGHEYVNGYGARAREIPLSGDAAGWAAGWGTVGGVGLWSAMRQLGAYYDQMLLETTPVDLGAAATIMLDLFHEMARSNNNRYGTKAANIDRWTPMHPYEDVRVRRTDYSLGWKSREILHGGVPRQPLRDVWWEAAWTSGGGAWTPTVWNRAVPGMLIYARQYAVRLRAIEPLPLFQLMSGRVIVAAYEMPAGAVTGEATGSMKRWPGAASTIPAGWLLCDGTAVSRTTYAALFAITGVAYGIGDGSTTFNLPNLSDTFDKGAPNDAGLGVTGGAATHSHAATQTALVAPAAPHAPGVLAGGAANPAAPVTATPAANSEPPFLKTYMIIKT